MLAARGRGAAPVAAAVRGALRGQHPAADHAPLRPRRLPAGRPGPPGFLYLDFFFFFSSREDAAVITKVRGALGEVLRLAFLGPLCRPWART